MASSFSLRTNSYDGRYLRLNLSQTRNIANNTSTINWTLTSTGGSVNYYNVNGVEVWVNGSRRYGPVSRSWSSRTFPAAKGSTSGSVTVAHDSDGTKSISVVLKGRIYWDQVETFSGTWQLDPNPRTSSFRVLSSSGSAISSLELGKGEGIKISVSRASTSLTHIAYYKVGNITSWTRIGGTDKFGTTREWSNLDSLGRSIPNSTSARVSFRVETYSGNSLLGATEQSPLTIRIPNEWGPTVGSISVAREYYGDVYNKSRIKDWYRLITMPRVTYSASGVQGATISRLVISSRRPRSNSDSTLVQWTKDETIVASRVSRLYGAFQSKGRHTFTVTAYDSRGLSNSRTTQIDVRDYFYPRIISFDAYRCDESGVRNPTGEHFFATATYETSQNSGFLDPGVVGPVYVTIRRDEEHSKPDLAASHSKGRVTISMKEPKTLLRTQSVQIFFIANDGASRAIRRLSIGMASYNIGFHPAGGVAFGKVPSTPEVADFQYTVIQRYVSNPFETSQKHANFSSVGGYRVGQFYFLNIDVKVVPGQRIKVCRVSPSPHWWTPGSVATLIEGGSIMTTNTYTYINTTGNVYLYTQNHAGAHDVRLYFVYATNGNELR